MSWSDRGEDKRERELGREFSFCQSVVVNSSPTRSDRLEYIPMLLSFRIYSDVVAVMVATHPDNIFSSQ